MVNASAYRLGRTQNPMPARVMKAVTVGSDAANPDAAIPVARSGHDLAAKPGDLGGMHFGSTHRASAGALPYAP